MRRRICLLVVLLAVGLGSIRMLTAADAPAASPAPPAPKAEARNAEWAAPVEAAGVPNLHKVADGVYRSAQPLPEGFGSLEKLGVKTVINLRARHDDADEAKDTKLRLVHVPIDTWRIRDEDVIRVQKMLARKEDGPFLIHCQHGADRTGLMCAMYRILAQGWTKEKALDEMQNGGYGFHALWRNIIRYVEKADTEAMKKALAPEPPAAPSAALPPAKAPLPAAA